jgi:hypothetical protein
MLPGAQAKPLFPNSVVSNDIDFIRADDPTVEFEVSMAFSQIWKMRCASEGRTSS